MYQLRLFLLLFLMILCNLQDVSLLFYHLSLLRGQDRIRNLDQNEAYIIINGNWQ